MQTTVATVLKKKGHAAWSVSPTTPVHEAIRMMTDKRVEALLVLSDNALVGIVSERDCARQVVLQGKDPRGVPVSAIMSSPAIFVSPAHTVGDCMWIVASKRVTHLPVVDNGALVGVVSSGDLIRSIVQTQGEMINHLEGYISGKYPG